MKREYTDGVKRVRVIVSRSRIVVRDPAHAGGLFDFTGTARRAMMIADKLDYHFMKRGMRRI